MYKLDMFICYTGKYSTPMLDVSTSRQRLWVRCIFTYSLYIRMNYLYWYPEARFLSRPKVELCKSLDHCFCRIPSFLTSKRSIRSLEFSEISINYFPFTVSVTLIPKSMENLTHLAPLSLFKAQNLNDYLDSLSRGFPIFVLQNYIMFIILKIPVHSSYV